MSEICVVTGASRGIGLATSKGLAQKGYHVIMTARNISELEVVVNGFKDEGLSVEMFYCDVTNQSSIVELANYIEKKYGHLDILVNNAAILLDRLYQPLNEVSPETLLKTFDTNTVGCYRMMIQLMPLLQKSPMARIVNVSSGAGQLSTMQSRLPAYRISKSALNALTCLVSSEFSNDKLKVNSICPGWVKTAIGGDKAPLTLEEGAKGVIWAATLGPDGPTGKFFRDEKPLEW